MPTQSFVIHLEGNSLDIRLGEIRSIECWMQPDGIYKFTFVSVEGLQDDVLMKPEDFKTLTIL
jgi:hypothetical protein